MKENRNKNRIDDDGLSCYRQNSDSYSLVEFSRIFWLQAHTCEECTIIIGQS